MEKKTLFIILGVVGGVLLFGCACAGVGMIFVVGRVRQADRDVRLNDLKEVALAMHNYHEAFRRTPANIEDFQPFLQLSSRVMDRLRKGEIVVVLDALPLPNQTGGTANVIYAWDTRPAAGDVRLVAFMDGSTRALTEAEFQNTPKALTAKTSK